MQRVGLRNQSASTQQQENAGGIRGKAAAGAGVGLGSRPVTRAALGDLNRNATKDVNAGGKDVELKKAGYGARAQGHSRLARPPLHAKENEPQRKSSIFQKGGLSAANRPLTRQAAAANLKQASSKQVVAAAVPAPSALPEQPTVEPSVELSEDVEMPSPAKATPEPVEISDDAVSAHTYDTSVIPDIDEGDDEDPQLAARFAVDIYKYLRHYEKQMGVKEDFLTQKVVTPRMRGILVDWLQQVHTRFHLLPETIYLAIQIIDRYLEKVMVSKEQLQLVGVTGMLIAAKYEEMYAPEINDFVYITDDTYTAKQVLQMEMKMLSALNCNLGRPLPIHFLRRFSKAADADYIVHTMGKYFMELALCEYTLAADLPSHLAGGALHLTLTLLQAHESGSLSGAKGVWSPTLHHYSGLRSDDHLAPVVRKLAKLLLKVHSDKTKLQAVRSKFSTPKFHSISQHEALNTERLKELAA